MVGINGVSGTSALPAVNGAQPDTTAPARNADSAAELQARDAARRAAALPEGAVSTSNGERQAKAAEVQQSADKVQQLLAKAAPNLTFAVDQDSGRTVIKIVDPATKEVLRQIPAEEILRMDKNIDQMIQRFKGLLIDRQG